MRRVGAGAVLILVLLLAGCSQVAAISPVGGSRLAEVRFATLDLLVQHAVDVRTAPICNADAKTITCVGDDAAGDAIAAESLASDTDRLTVKVGGATLYDGSLQSVLEGAMESDG